MKTEKKSNTHFLFKGPRGSVQIPREEFTGYFEILFYFTFNSDQKKHKKIKVYKF